MEVEIKSLLLLAVIFINPYFAYFLPEQKRERENTRW